MAEKGEYDRFADIWSVWIGSVPEVCAANRRFYVERYVETEGPAVELGVGDGRIALEAVRRGKPMIGVDDSHAMLDLCRASAEAQGLSAGITLQQADFREFHLEEPAALVAIPFHSIGHMRSLDDKRDCLTHIHGQLAPGGRLIFDHFIADRELIASRDAVPTLRTTYVDEESGHEVLLWVVSNFDLATQGIDVRAITEELDGEGVVARRKVRRIRFSWVEPDQVRVLLGETGFEIEDLRGGFVGEPFDPDARHQVWIARRA